MEETRNPRRITTVRQLELLIEFLEEHRDLALGKVRSKEARALASRLWHECANILNVEGPFRTAKEWAKFWNDYKCRVRKLIIAQRQSRNGTGGGPPCPINLSDIDERIANIIGHDVGPLPNVGQDPFQVMDMNVENEGVDLEINIDVEGHSLSQASGASSMIVGEDIIVLDCNSPQASTSQQADHNYTESVAGPEESTTHSNEPNTSQQRSTRHRNDRSRSRHTLQRSNREALEESRSAIAQIEILRAKAEEARAQQELKQAEANLENIKILKSIAQSFEIMARAFDRMSRRQQSQGRLNVTDED